MFRTFDVAGVFNGAVAGSAADCCIEAVQMAAAVVDHEYQRIRFRTAVQIRRKRPGAAFRNVDFRIEPVPTRAGLILNREAAVQLPGVAGVNGIVAVADRRGYRHLSAAAILLLASTLRLLMPLPP